MAAMQLYIKPRAKAIVCFWDILRTSNIIHQCKFTVNVLFVNTCSETRCPITWSFLHFTTSFSRKRKAFRVRPLILFVFIERISLDLPKMFLAAGQKRKKKRFIICTKCISHNGRLMRQYAADHMAKHISLGCISWEEILFLGLDKFSWVDKVEKKFVQTGKDNVCIPDLKKVLQIPRRRSNSKSTWMKVKMLQSLERAERVGRLFASTSKQNPRRDLSAWLAMGFLWFLKILTFVLANNR